MSSYVCANKERGKRSEKGTVHVWYISPSGRWMGVIEMYSHTMVTREVARHSQERGALCIHFVGNNNKKTQHGVSC